MTKTQTMKRKKIHNENLLGLPLRLKSIFIIWNADRSNASLLFEQKYFPWLLLFCWIFSKNRARRIRLCFRGEHSLDCICWWKEVADSLFFYTEETSLDCYQGLNAETDCLWMHIYIIYAFIATWFWVP